MLRKDPTIYTAMFSGLRLTAFGISQTFPGIYTVKVFQSRVSPEVWKCSPGFAKGNIKWEAATAEGLMEMISANFEDCVQPWEAMPERRPAKPSLMNPAAEAVARRSRKLGNAL